jgi:hypothetical protein
VPVLNSDFFSTPGSNWIADNWTYSVSTAIAIVGFGDSEDPLEIFTWSEFSVDMSSAIPCLFDMWSEFYETWGTLGDFYSEWYSGWVTLFSDEFVWSVFADTFIAGVFTGFETFDWSIFNDIFTPGFDCWFNLAGVPVKYEDFELLW